MWFTMLEIMLTPWKCTASDAHMHSAPCSLRMEFGAGYLFDWRCQLCDGVLFHIYSNKHEENFTHFDYPVRRICNSGRRFATKYWTCLSMKKDARATWQYTYIYIYAQFWRVYMHMAMKFKAYTFGVIGKCDRMPHIQLLGWRPFKAFSQWMN